MRIKLGWSGETSPNVWVKTAVEVDEGDLLRVLRAVGLGNLDPIRLSTVEVYQLLDNEAERLLLAKLISRYGHDPVHGRAKLDELNAARAALTARLQAAHGNGGAGAGGGGAGPG